MKKVYNIALIVLLTFSGSIAVQAQNSSNFEISKNLDIFTTVCKELNNNYVDELNYGDLIKTGIDAMLNKLDPYTVYISESQIEDFAFMTTGQYGGIGALIHKQGDYVVVSEPYEGSPAIKAGLIPGDRILKINEKDAKGKSVSDVSAILKGQPGTSIKITIGRDGEKSPIEITVMRENVSIPNVAYAEMLDENTGYIKLTGFTQNSGKEVRDAFMKLKESGTLKGLIVDLRDNGGGLMNEAVSITNLFVKKGELVVSTKGKTPDRNKSYKTFVQPVDLDIPMVVLVNGYSASASEIVAGALQDLDRAVILGERTFGKGLVQNIIPLTYNTQMKVTVAKYYIPSGRCIQAIDYATHDSLGYSRTIPDSLINSFKTKAGRIVYDGGGIVPDISAEEQIASNIAVSLITKYLIFDYANKFRREHESIAEPKEFVITDDIFNDFVAWLHDKDYDYTTRSEKMLSDLKKTAEKEQYYTELKPEFDLLESKMMHNKQADLIKYSDDIKSMLRSEIVSRYYFQKGRIKASLTEDKEVKSAIEILKDEKTYKAILDGTSNLTNTKS
ncbi:MAG: peptidase S41 [Bacteroidetes bacterium HGW-Bacteroidetes-9]|jgi:carboxyl-terminal processing protease|nr:MAG: peptidase S41 [Bacteroidetes bacterium HGW-Bacteroidetes-9]